MLPAKMSGVVDGDVEGAGVVLDVIRSGIVEVEAACVVPLDVVLLDDCMVEMLISWLHNPPLGPVKPLILSNNKNITISTRCASVQEETAHFCSPESTPPKLQYQHQAYRGIIACHASHLLHVQLVTLMLP